jgi:hypothetical protein
MSVVLLTSLLGVIMGVASLGCGLWTLGSRLRMWERATGTVIGIDPDDVISRTPVVTFVTPLGRPVRFVVGNDMGFSRVRIGGMVPVRYRASDPSKARIATFYMSFLLPAFYAVGGAFILAVLFGIVRS